MTQGVMAKKFAEEIKKCKEDIFYFAEKYCYILHPTRGKIPAKLFDYQKKYVKAVLDNRNVVVDKARQMGFSTITAIIALWWACFQPNKEVVIVSISDKDAMYLLNERVRFIYDNCPKWLVGRLTKATEHIVKFDNKSWIEALATTKKALTGRSPSMAIIDEIAFNQYANEMMVKAMPSLIHGEKLVLISTRNGTDGIGAYYYNVVEKARSKENDFCLVEADWWESPLYNDNAPNYVHWEDNKWARDRHGEMPEKGFRQEILREWIMTGETVLPQRVIDTLQMKMPIRTDFIRPTDITPEEADDLSDTGWDVRKLYAKGFWVWEEPIEGHHYVIGCDLSTGRGDDFTTAEVIDIDTMTQVAEYKHRIPTKYFPEILIEMGKYYNQAFIGIEINSDETAVNELEKIGWECLYYRFKQRQGAKKGVFYAGWETNTKTRPILVNNFIDTMIEERIKIYSDRLIRECRTFVYRGNKPQHALQAHDDLIFGFMIADYIIPAYIEQQGIDIELKKRSIDYNGGMGKILPLAPMTDESNMDLNGKWTKFKELNPNKIAKEDLSHKERMEGEYKIDTTHYEWLGISKPKEEDI